MGLLEGQLITWQLALSKGASESERIPARQKSQSCNNLKNDMPSLLLYSFRSESLGSAHIQGEGITQRHKY